MKKSIKILCIVFGIPLGLILLAVLFFVANDIYQQLPHHITDVEEIQYLIPYFEDMPIESCDCRWEADVIFMGEHLKHIPPAKLRCRRSIMILCLKITAGTRAAAFLLRL